MDPDVADDARSGVVGRPGWGSGEVRDNGNNRKMTYQSVGRHLPLRHFKPVLVADSPRFTSTPGGAASLS